ncbi:YkoF-like protein [Microdochium bolleyi]|uniref:YkoF-like protein n=1 Tax=Microdochium bolleyi TaxID=196109 RepID=A0A136JBB9_9PEZI|nr:YkoF-like protein [Microdochium bolleyi]
MLISRLARSGSALSHCARPAEHALRSTTTRQFITLTGRSDLAAQQQQLHFHDTTSARRHFGHSRTHAMMDNSSSSAVPDESRFADVPVPERCYADFCLVPVGTGSVSVAEEVAEVQRLLRASGLTYTMHSAGTTLEGSWEQVFKVIGQAHTVVHQKGVLRVQTSMRVGTRTDKAQTAKDKVQRVEDLLASSK